MIERVYEVDYEVGDIDDDFDFEPPFVFVMSISRVKDETRHLIDLDVYVFNTDAKVLAMFQTAIDVRTRKYLSELKRYGATDALKELALAITEEIEEETPGIATKVYVHTRLIGLMEDNPGLRPLKAFIDRAQLQEQEESGKFVPFKVITMGRLQIEERPRNEAFTLKLPPRVMTGQWVTFETIQDLISSCVWQEYRYEYATDEERRQMATLINVVKDPGGVYDDPIQRKRYDKMVEVHKKWRDEEAA